MTDATCPLCGGATLHEILSQDDWCAFAQTCDDERQLHAAQLTSNPELAFGGIVRCAGCGFRTVARMPESAALTDFYQQYFANRRYADKRGKKIARAQKWLKRLGRPQSGARFLDVGCNQGFAVEAARSMGYAATGIEIDAEAVRGAAAAFPEADFVCATAEAHAAGHPGGYDLVWSSEVIEHVPDVRAFAAALAALVAPGGQLFVTTPDAGHWRRPRDFKTWGEVKPPEHVSWFTQQNLRGLFEPQGFRVQFFRRWKPGIHMRAVRTG